MKDLFLSKYFVPHIVSALQGPVGEGAMEVLPTLENVFIEQFLPSGSVYNDIKLFVAGRQLSGWPIVVSCWDKIGNGASFVSDDRPKLEKIVKAIRI